MPTIDEEINHAGELNDHSMGDSDDRDNGVTRVQSRIDLSFLKAPTGDGTVEMYMDHPMNFNGAKSTARVLRGLTGMLGNLNYAIVDISIGLMDMMKGAKKKGPMPGAELPFREHGTF